MKRNLKELEAGRNKESGLYDILVDMDAKSCELTEVIGSAVQSVKRVIPLFVVPFYFHLFLPVRFLDFLLAFLHFRIAV